MDNKSNYELFEVHRLWVIVKQLEILIGHIVLNFTLNENNESNVYIWELITPKVEEFLDCIKNHNAIGIIISTGKEEILREKKVWENYKNLVEDLMKLLLIRDYNIIQDYDAFVNVLYEHIICFENKINTLLTQP